MTSLRQTVGSSTRWTAGSTLFGAGLQLIQLAVLARLLQPSDFGLMAMVLVVVGLAQAFADAGISNAIIHRQDVSAEQLSSLYWLTVISGVACFALLIALSPLIVLFYREERLAGLLGWSAAAFLVTPFGQQFQILLQKELRFKELAILESLATLAGAVVAIGLAWSGSGVWSLVWGLLTAAASRAALLSAVGWREWPPALRLRREDLRGFIGFGLFQIGERSINYLNQRLDQLLIGSLAGAQALGYYNLAFNLVMQPAARINAVLTRVAFPVFARVQRDQGRLTRGYMILRRVLATVDAPLILGLAAVAPILIPAVFGERWNPAVRLVQVLAVVALLRSTGNPVGSLLLARGRADLGFKWNVALLLTQLPGVCIGAYLGGALGVALAILILQIVYAAAEYLFLIRPLLGECLRAYASSVAPATGTALLMAAAVLLTPALLDARWLITIAVQVVLGAAIYAGLNWIFFRRQVEEVLHLLRG